MESPSTNGCNTERGVAVEDLENKNKSPQPVSAVKVRFTEDPVTNKSYFTQPGGSIVKQTSSI
jgi:hypothetical protein